MSSMEWFSRIENALRISLPEVSAEFDDYELQFKANTTEIHPLFSFYTELGEKVLEFCNIYFDPTNQEFYAYYFNHEFELDSKLLFNELDEMIEFVYDSFFDMLDIISDEEDEESDEDEEYEYVEEFDLDETNGDDSDEYPYSQVDILDEQIEWISNDKHIHIETNVEDQKETAIHLKLGIDEETGEGLIYRSIISKDIDEEEVQTTSFFTFKEEEASYLLDLIHDYLAHLENK